MDPDTRSQRHSEYSSSRDPEKLDEESDGGYAPIKASAAADSMSQRHYEQRRSSATSRSIERSWSLNDGYSCCGGYEEPKNDEAQEGTQGSEYTVGWDEDDPENPRNFKTLRRWMIVLICSSGSLCVYVSAFCSSGSMRSC